MNRGWFGIGVMGLLLTTCRPVKEWRQTTYDSVRVVHETLRDTTVIIRADSSWLRALLECDSSGQVILKELLDYQVGKYTGIPAIEIEENMLTAKMKIDSFGIFLTLRDRYENVMTNRVVHLTEIREINRLRGWQKSLIGLGIIFLFLSVGYLWRFLKV